MIYCTFSSQVRILNNFVLAMDDSSYKYNLNLIQIRHMVPFLHTVSLAFYRYCLQNLHWLCSCRCSLSHTSFLPEYTHTHTHTHTHTYIYTSFFGYCKAHFAIRHIPNFATQVFKLKISLKYPELKKIFSSLFQSQLNSLIIQLAESEIVNNGIKVICTSNMSTRIFGNWTKVETSHT